MSDWCLCVSVNRAGASWFGEVGIGNRAFPVVSGRWGDWPAVVCLGGGPVWIDDIDPLRKNRALLGLLFVWALLPVAGACSL